MDDLVLSTRCHGPAPALAAQASSIGKLRSDSRQVTPGDLFVAVPGVAVDGHRYAAAALARGAAALVLEREVEGCEGCPRCSSPIRREALA